MMTIVASAAPAHAKRVWRAPILLGLACGLGLIALACGCLSEKDGGLSPSREVLEGLVREHASLAEVTRQHGPFEFREKGTKDWDALLEFLAPMRGEEYLPLRQATTKYPKILFKGSDRYMMWLFFDEHDALQGYYKAVQ